MEVRWCGIFEGKATGGPEVVGFRHDPDICTEAWDMNIEL